MTREEAIDWLKAISFVSDHNITEAIDLAIEALHREEAEANGYCHRIKPKEDFKEVVVRCTDCRHSRVYQTDSKGTMQTHCVAFVMPRTVTDDDFCSWGERREK